MASDGCEPCSAQHKEQHRPAFQAHHLWLVQKYFFKFASQKDKKMLTVAKIVFSVVLQHGMMIKPTSRNAIDRTLPAFFVSKHMRA